MFWKKWPMWLRGGSLFVILMVIINIPLLILSLTSQCLNDEGENSETCNLLLFVGFTPGVLVWIFIDAAEPLILYISIAVYFILGALFGSVVGTMKGKETSVVQARSAALNLKPKPQSGAVVIAPPKNIPLP